MLCVVYAYVLRVWLDGTRPRPVFHLTGERLCVSLGRILETLKVELQSRQEKDNNLELAYDRHEGLASRAQGANFPALRNRISNATKVFIVALKKR